MHTSASFIIPAYNAERYLEEAIASCLSQTVLPKQIIVVDDGSKDSTRAIILKFASQSPQIVIPVLCDANEGRALACNKGIDKLESKYCLFLDADDVALPERVERQVAFMEEHPEVYASSSFVNYINKDGRVVAKGVLPVVSLDNYRGSMERNEVIGLYSPASIVRTSVFAEEGFRFRSEFRQSQDMDLWTRIAERHVVYAQPEILTNYRIHAGSVTTAKFRRSRLYFDYVRDCMIRRRAGIGERSLSEFMDFRKRQPMWIRIARWRKDSAKTWYHRSGMHFAEKRHVFAAVCFGMAFLFQPFHVLRRVRSQYLSRRGAQNE